MRRVLFCRGSHSTAIVVHIRQTSVGASAGQNNSKPSPLAVLDRFFKTDKHGAQLNYHLLLAISEGEAEQAATVARILASHVKSFLENQQASAQPKEVQAQEKGDVGLACSPSDIEHAVEKIAACATASLGMRDTPGGTANRYSDSQKSYWKDPSSLTITILETSFETIAASEEDSVGSEADLKLLDEYLKNESERWKQQKHAIAKVVLDKLKTIGLSPSHIHHSDDFVVRDSTQATGLEKLNPLKHCNIIIRGEVPNAESLIARCGEQNKGIVEQEVVARKEEAEEELQLLEARLSKRGAPAMTPEERSIALMELVMGKSKMQYSVGMHRALSECIDHCFENEKGSGDAPLLSSEAVTKEIMEALNACGAAVDNELRLAVETPVIPFTFMLKMCIWYQPKD